MKKNIILLLAVFLLTACTSSNLRIQNQQALSPATKDVNNVLTPKIPEKNKTQEDATQTTENSIDLKEILKDIDKNLSQENITKQEIERGWYYAQSNNDKKIGTPDSWTWQNNGLNSRWLSPAYVEKKADDDIDELCQDTAGAYAISCAEQEISSCENISKSTCNCSYGSKWVDNEGCIKTEGKKIVTIKSDELMQGWYYGLKSEKKSGTPKSWVWTDAGQQSKWHNPGSSKK